MEDINNTNYMINGTQTPSLFSPVLGSGERTADSEPMASLRHDSPSIAFPSYSQLPTPQSPSNFGYYVSCIPDTPAPQALHPCSTRPTTSTGSKMSLVNENCFDISIHNGAGGDTKAITDVQQQVATPESSPFARASTRYMNPVTPNSDRPLSRMETPKLKAKQNLVASANSTPLTLAPAPKISSPILTSYGKRASQLSSPFMTKLSIVEQGSKSRTARDPRSQSNFPGNNTPLNGATVMRDPNASNITLPDSDTLESITPPLSAAGGEMERIREVIMQDRLAHFQEVESRRPDYLKRAKRSPSGLDSAIEQNEDYHEREIAIGIMESPIKGRRLKLFQETSEESFEESLMAGGYGRYRTADWVRQPQPVALNASAMAGSSDIVSVLEQAEEPAPLTEKELRKRKRLAAFTERPNGKSNTNIQPVELEGHGRVLLDVPFDSDDVVMAEGGTPRKKGANRRKKREPSGKQKKAMALTAAVVDDLPEKPNWPDTLFPWQLRTKEREDALKAEEAEKMKWIGRFLDRDSDDDEEDEEDEEVTRSSTDEYAFVGGLGKSIPLPGSIRYFKNGMSFPSDSSDARAALMSKRSARALFLRKQKRRRHGGSSDGLLCLCNGTDDGRELVQCDDCETWYHLECLGIKDVAELGNEEDEWFCPNCEAHRKFAGLESSEPTFAPTDERPRRSPSYDASLFQPASLQDSPMTWGPHRLPQTPTRNRDSDFELGLTSGQSSWIGSSRNKPVTPQHSTHFPRIYNSSTPGLFEHPFDESPFDPTSTPSRGIKFNASFTTPKSNAWSSRAIGLFQTPSKPGGGRTSANRVLGGAGIFSSALDESGRHEAYDNMDSPVRRARSHDGSKPRRALDSPLAARSTFPNSHHFLEESPVMRYHEIGRRHGVNDGSVS